MFGHTSSVSFEYTKDMSSSQNKYCKFQFRFLIRLFPSTMYAYKQGGMTEKILVICAIVSKRKA